MVPALRHMTYSSFPIAHESIPQAADPLFQHVLETYASESNKLIATWRHFEDADLQYRPHPKSSTVLEILKHELLSQRRFFAEFLGTVEPPAADVLPDPLTIHSCMQTAAENAHRRLEQLATRSADWWLETVPFFDVARQRIWVFWRRVLHTAHHRTQLTVYLRFLNRPVPAVYGPSADESWSGADPTYSNEAAERRG